MRKERARTTNIRSLLTGGHTCRLFTAHQVPKFKSSIVLRFEDEDLLNFRFRLLNFTLSEKYSSERVEHFNVRRVKL